MENFDELWSAVSDWAEKHSQLILTTGSGLAVDQIVMARKVGVKHPEKIRVLVVPSIPFPEDSTIRAIAEHVGLKQNDSAGLTLGHGVYIREDHMQNKRLMCHELRHVSQYECFGSVRGFMFFYLKEMLHFGYEAGPLEIDAIRASDLIGR